MIHSFFPRTPNGLAFIGDMPRSETSAAPFSESYYGTMASICRDAGFEFKHSFHGNLLNHYPDQGRWSEAQEPLLEASLAQLDLDLKTYSPKAIVLLGDRVMRKFKPDASKIDDERGQPFLWNNTPTLISYHPKQIFIQYHLRPLLVCDLIKAKKYADKGWKPPEFNIIARPTFEQVLEWLNRFLVEKPMLACDIETDSAMRMTCVGFAYNRSSAITIPLSVQNKRIWSYEEEKRLWPLLCRVLEECPLLGHHAVHFDHGVLCLSHRIIPNFVADTEFSHWECYPEMKKSLSFCNSLYTDFPYWKDELKQARQGKIDPWKEFEYNARDNIVCLNCGYEIMKELSELPQAVTEHYRFNIRVSQAFQYMFIRGVDLDDSKRKQRLIELKTEAEDLQLLLAEQAGKDINVNSPKQVKHWLYNELKLPVQYKQHKDEDGYVEDRESADFLSLLYLARSYPNLPALSTASKLRKLKKRISSLTAYRTRPNGRISWTHSLVGTKTGRASGYIPLDGCGVQPQNVDSRDRDLFLAGDGCYWLKADLEGADSWTVAAQCAKLGDWTMMEDLMAGLKPAQALAIAQLFGHELISSPAEELVKYKADLKDKTKQEESLRGKKRSTYDVMKAVSHGSNYGMQKFTMHQNIFKKSEGELWVTPSDCALFQSLYFRRYKGLHKVHEMIVSLLNDPGYIDSFGGTRRTFFGRKDTNTFRQAMAHLPQANTNFATNKLIERIYYWSENRREDGVSLILEPVNQVHDETCCIFRKDELEQVKSFLNQATQFQMNCWGVDFTIPFEMQYGDNWGECYYEF